MNLKEGQRRKKMSERREEGRLKNAQPHPLIRCGGLTAEWKGHAPRRRHRLV
jgi:hypothetical protein